MTLAPGRRARALRVIAAAPPTAFLLVFLVVPLLGIIHVVIKDGAGGGAGGVAGADVARAAISTISFASAGTALAICVGMPAAWAVSWTSWRGASATRAVLSAPFVLPTVVVAIAFLSLEREFSAWSPGAAGLIIAALAFFNIAVVLRVVGPPLQSVDRRLLTAAAVLGAPPVRAAITVVWPGIRRPLASAAAVTFLLCSTSFALVLVLGETRVRTLETSAYLEVTAYLNVPGAGIYAAVQAAVVTTVILAVGRWGTLAAGREPRSPASGPRLATRKDVGWLIAALLPAMMLVLLPATALISRAFRGDGTWSTAYVAMLADPEVVAPGTPSLLEAAAMSIGLALIATVVSCALTACVVVATAARRSWRWLRVLTIAPLAVSSVVLGLGLLVTLAGPARTLGDLGTAVLLVAAQTLVALPLALRIAMPALDDIEPRMIAAARTLGATSVGAMRHVILPLVRRPALVAVAVSFAIAIGEFGASAFLVRPGVPTLPTAIVRLLGRPGPESLAVASAAALLLALLAGGAMLLADIASSERRSRHATR